MLVIYPTALSKKYWDMDFKLPVLSPTRKKVAMRAAKDCRSGEGRPLFAREDLALSIGLILGGDAQAADVLARLFEELGQAMEGGLRGINEVREALAAAVGICYLHSEAHAAAMRLYRLSVEGHLKSEDEPVRLLGAAVERGAAKARASKAAGRGRR